MRGEKGLKGTGQRLDGHVREVGRKNRNNGPERNVKQVSGHVHL